MKKFVKLFAVFSLALIALSACGSSDSGKSAASSSTKAKTEKTSSSEKHDPVTLNLAAAASLKYSFDDKLIPMFQKAYPWITVKGTYDSSGKLQTQIEEGMDADVFFSAATKQMTALTDANLVDKDSVVDLLENKVVLIIPKDSKEDIKSFDDLSKANKVAVGDPASVPAGQYAKEALTSMNLWDGLQDKLSLGTNVTEVLNWVAEGSADAGVVYATDAATMKDKVKVVATAPADSLKTPVVYPIGIVTASKHKDEAKLLIDYLQKDDAMKVFEDYGFKSNLKK